jgi:hypothetical protein
VDDPHKAGHDGFGFALSAQRFYMQSEPNVQTIHNHKSANGPIKAKGAVRSSQTLLFP